MADLKLIVFDLFGVILSKGLKNALSPLSSALNSDPIAVESAYTEFEPEFDAGLIGETEFWNFVNNKLGTNVEGSLLTNIILSGYQINSDTVKMIELYRKNYRVILYSNYRRCWYDQLDRKFNISKLFDDVYISSDTGILKPSKKVFDLICSDNCVSPSEIAFFDDNTDNISSALSIGVKAHRFSSPYSADRRIRDLYIGKSIPYKVSYSGVFLQTSTGALILQRRDNIREISNPGRISVFGGRRLTNESSLSCAQRELHEETGIQTNKTDLELVTSLSCPIEGGAWMECDYYLLKNVDLKDVKIFEGQSAELYYPTDAINDPQIIKIVRYAVEKHLQRN